MTQVDYKTLIQQRKSKGSRQPVRHVICLDPDLYAELEEAQQDLNEVLISENREDAPPQDRRGGSLTPRAKAEQRVADIESRIGEVSIVGVFKVPTSERQAEMIDELSKLQDSDPDHATAFAVAHGKKTILETFDHFEGPNRKRLDELSRDDLADMLPDWSQGEVVALGNKITRASVELHDAPKSVRLSLLNQHSDAT